MAVSAGAQRLRGEIGRRCRAVRKALRLTQEEMADRLHTGRSNYSRLENGGIFPSVPMLLILHTDFHVSLEWLLTGSGEMRRNLPIVMPAEPRPRRRGEI